MEVREKKCQYCASAKDPSYKQPDDLTAFLTDRGKIFSRSRSYLCARHQRRLTKAVKRARLLALLPFAQRVS